MEILEAAWRINEEGLRLAKSGSLREALKKFETAAKTAPQVAAFRNNLGNCHRLLGDERLALEEYNEAIQLEPGFPDPYPSRAIIRKRQGDIDQALRDIQTFRRIIELSKRELSPEIKHLELTIQILQAAKSPRREVHAPKNKEDRDPTIENLFKDACSRADEHDYEGAITALTRALETESSQVSCLVMRGEIYYQLQQYLAAVKDLTDAVNLDPSQHRALTLRADLLFAIGENREAAEDYTRAISLTSPTSHSAELLVKRARCYQALEMREQAIKDLDLAVAIEPTHVETRLERGRLNIKEDPKSAEAETTCAINASPLCAEAYLIRGYARALSSNALGASLDLKMYLDFQQEESTRSESAEDLLSKITLSLDEKRDAAHHPVAEIRSVIGSNPPRFRIRARALSEEPFYASFISPEDMVVQGHAGLSLRGGLDWYFDTYDHKNDNPELNKKARNILRTLEAWVDSVYKTLRLKDVQLDSTRFPCKLQIWSSDPAVLSWPWEALRSKKVFDKIERIIPTLKPIDLSAIPRKRPRTVRILFLSPRSRERDLPRLAVTNSLLELANSNDSIQCRFLRPPTFRSLADHLQQNSDAYDVLHFDGHGFSKREGESLSQFFIFEDADGNADPVQIDTLCKLLKRDNQRFYLIAFNACKSGQVDTSQETVLSAAAALLLESCRCPVLAMAFSLSEAGARHFYRSFYETLSTGSLVDEAVTTGCEAMIRARNRDPFSLQDAIVPVLYQTPETFSEESSIVPNSAITSSRDTSENPSYLWDSNISKMEEFSRRGKPVLVIQGLSGAGKTNLVKKFLFNLRLSSSEEIQHLWIDAIDADDVWDLLRRILGSLTGSPQVTSNDVLIRAAASEVRRRNLFVIISQFERASSFLDQAFFTDNDRDIFRNFVEQIEGGSGKVVLLSSISQQWLGTHHESIILLGLEDGDVQTAIDRSPYHSTRAARSSFKFFTHLSSIEAIAQLEIQNGESITRDKMLQLLYASEYGKEVRRRVNDMIKSLGSGDIALLYSLSNFRDYVDPLAAQFVASDISVKPGVFLAIDESNRNDFTTRFNSSLIDHGKRSPILVLISGGLLSETGSGLLSIHPVFETFLRQRESTIFESFDRDDWEKKFAFVMCGVSQEPYLKEHFLHPRSSRDELALRKVYDYYQLTLENAFDQARRQEMSSDACYILATLAGCNSHFGDFLRAERYYQKLAKYCHSIGNIVQERISYSNLANIAYERGDKNAAFQYRSTAISLLRDSNEQSKSFILLKQQALLCLDMRRFDDARELLNEVANQHPFSLDAAEALAHLAEIEYQAGNLQTARDLYGRSARLFGLFGNRSSEAKCFSLLIKICNILEEHDAADSWAQELLSTQAILLDSSTAAPWEPPSGLGNTVSAKLKAAEKAQNSGLLQLAVRRFCEAAEIEMNRKQGEQAGAYFEQAFQLANASGDILLLMRPLYGLCVTSFFNGESSQGEMHLKSILGFLRPLGQSSDAAYWKLKVSETLLSRGDLSAATNLVNESRSFADVSHDRDLIGEVAMLDSLIFSAQGRVKEATQAAERAINIKRQLGDNLAVIRYSEALGGLYRTQGDYGRALDVFLQALEVSDSIGAEAASGQLIHSIGVIHLSHSRYRSAERWFRRLLTLGRDSGDLRLVSEAYFQLGCLFNHKQKWDEAADLFHRAIAAAEGTAGDRRTKAFSYTLLGLIDIGRDDEQARTYLTKAVEYIDFNSEPDGLFISVVALARSQRVKGNTEATIECLALAETVACKVGESPTMVQFLLEQGLEQERRGNGEQAESLLRRGFTLAERVGVDFNGAQIYHILGRRAFDQGSIDFALQAYGKLYEFSIGNSNHQVALSTCAEVCRRLDQLGGHDAFGIWQSRLRALMQTPQNA